MRRYLLPVPALVAAVLTFGLPAAAQENEKDKEKEKTKVTPNEEIIIKRKTDKDGKVTIEIKDGEISVNGKSLEDYEDENIVVRKRKTTTSINTSPFRSEGGTRLFNGDAQGFSFNESTTPFLGVVTEKDEKGARIEDVTEGSGADKAGLKEDDVITKIDDYKIENPEDLTKAIRKHKPDDKVTITYERKGKSEKATAKLGSKPSITYAMPRIRTNPDVFKWDDNMHGFGITTGKPRLGIKAEDTEDGNGVKVLEVDEESAAEKAGIKEGDVITEFDGKDIKSVDELASTNRSAQAAQKAVIKVKFNRNGKSQTVDIKIPRKLKTANL